MAKLKVAVFAEGSEAAWSSRGRSALHEIWSNALVKTLGLHDVTRVIPIDKKCIVAMTPGVPKMSGAGERFDQLMFRQLKKESFDAAVVAWDLLPPWDPKADVCRWKETVALYEGIERSDCLPDEWIEAARARKVELSSRTSPSDRNHPAQLAQYAILPLCMEPVFESLLLEDEGLVREALGVRGMNVPGWPSWKQSDTSRCDLDVLGPALVAISALRPRLPVTLKIRPSIRTHKTDWGLFLVEQLSKTKMGLASIRGHRIAKRLIEILPKT